MNCGRAAYGTSSTIIAKKPTETGKRSHYKESSADRTIQVNKNVRRTQGAKEDGMSKLRILLVDDDTRFTDLMKGYLLTEERVGEVDTAADGREALERLKDKHYDLMTLDLIMPNTDGLTVLEQLPAVTGAAAPAVIVISALRNETMVRRCCTLRRPIYVTRSSPQRSLPDGTLSQPIRQQHRHGSRTPAFASQQSMQCTANCP